MLISNEIYKKIKRKEDVSEHEFQQLLIDAVDSYYTSDSPILEDDVFDCLKESFIEKYGYNPIGIGTTKTLKGFEKARHSIPMGSLEEFSTKKDVEAEVLKWATKYALEDIFCVSEKLDGLSVSVYYEKGILKQALTRGDGEFGDDITENVKKMMNIPTKLDIEFTGYVRGEIILLISMWKKYYPNSANPRNAAVGITKRKSGEGCEHLTIKFYKLYTEQQTFFSEKECFDFIKNKLKLPVPNNYRTNISAAIKLHQRYEQEIRDTLDYLLDGLVVAVDSLKRQNEVLENPLLPEFARKYKFESEKAATKLVSIRNQVGRTGALTPLALLEPVSCGGTTISKSTLHNYDEIRRLGLKIGDEVIVVRSKDVIPKIIGVAKSDPEGIEIEVPTNCPVCGTKLIQKETTIYCPNEDCDARIIKGILHWLNILKVKNLGVKLVEALINSEKLRCLPDLYNLKIKDISELERQGERRATKVINEINSKKEISLATFLAGLNIKNLSLKRAEILEDNFKTLEAVLNITRSDLYALDGFEDKLSTDICEGIQSKKELIKELLKHISLKKKMGGELDGKTFCFSGFRDTKLEEEIAKKGGRISSGVSKKLTYLVVKNKNSTTEKIKKARSYGIEILEPNDIDRMIHKGLF